MLTRRCATITRCALVSVEPVASPLTELGSAVNASGGQASPRVRRRPAHSARGLTWATLLGHGTVCDAPLDGAGNVLVPPTDTVPLPSGDAARGDRVFVVKLHPAGRTADTPYLGGVGVVAKAIAVNAADGAHIAGAEDAADIPLIPRALRLLGWPAPRVAPGARRGIRTFAVKLSAVRRPLLCSAIISGDDHGSDVGAATLSDRAGRAAVTRYTSFGPVPTTSPTLQATHLDGGQQAVCVAMVGWLDAPTVGGDIR
jgi:hypothetical protein